MNRKPLAITVAIVAAVVVVMVILLASGGGDAESGGADTAGDVVVGSGPRAPLAPMAADIKEASIDVDGSELSFAVVMEEEVPDLNGGSLEWRWEIREGGVQTWILTGNLALEPTAHLIATQKDYRSSTIYDSLPGDLSIDGKVVTVTLDVGEIEDFPETFQWTLLTTLDASRGVARSATAEDRAPDEGSFEFSGD